MKNIRISESEKSSVLIQNIADRPNSVSSYGEGNMTAAELKRRLDSPFLLMAEKHNLLCDGLGGIISSASEAKSELDALGTRADNIIGDLGEVKRDMVAVRADLISARDEALDAGTLAESAAESADASAEKADRSAEAADRAAAGADLSAAAADALTESLGGRILRCERRLSNLEDGIMPDNFYVDDEVASTVSVPLGVCSYAELASLGGTSVLPSDDLGKFEKTVIRGVISYSASGEELDRLMLSDSALSLDGYGYGIDASHCNRLSWDSESGRDTLIIGCGQIELVGDEDWYDTGELCDIAPIYALALPDAASGDAVSNYVSYQDLYCRDGELRVNGYFIYSVCQDASLDAWKSYLRQRKFDGTPLTVFYPLREPRRFDIGGALPDGNFILVEGGGTLRFLQSGTGKCVSRVIYQAPSGDTLADELDGIIALQVSYLTEVR